MSTIKVLVVDDHKIFSDSLKVLLENAGYFVKKSNNPEEALKFAKAESYDIIISDVEMPQMSGLEFVKQLKTVVFKDKPSPKIIVLTSHKNNSVFQKFVKLDIDAYLSKNVSNLELFSVFKKILSNQKYYESEIYNEYLSKNKSGNTVGFTPKELEVLKLIMQEKTTAEIAKDMDISAFTVEGHRKNLLQKTNSKNVVGLIKYVLINDVLN